MKKRAHILVSLMSWLVFMVYLPGVATAAKDQIDPPATVEGTVCPELQNGIDINQGVNFGTAVYRTVRMVVWEVGYSING